MKIIEENDRIVVPIVTETARIDKEEVVSGGVRVRKVVNERSEVVDPALMRQDAEITRVPIGRFVDVAPLARQEGSTWIVPVLEEVLVVEKRMRLKEEIHITQRSSEYHAPQTVTLRTEEAQIERWSADKKESVDAAD